VLFIKYDETPEEPLQFDGATTTVYELPGVTEILFLYPSPPPASLPPPTATTETEVIPVGATQV
jgi:hypothetical protein